MKQENQYDQSIITTVNGQVSLVGGKVAVEATPKPTCPYASKFWGADITVGGLIKGLFWSSLVLPKLYAKYEGNRNSC